MSYPLISKTIPYNLIHLSKVKAVCNIEDRVDRETLMQGKVDNTPYTIINEILFKTDYLETIDLDMLLKPLEGSLYVDTYMSEDIPSQKLEDYFEVYLETPLSEINYNGKDLILLDRLPEHKSILDVFKYSYFYKYDYSSCTYKAIPESERSMNYSKLRLRERITQEAGDYLDRIADYSKFIYFLLSKVSLSAEEKELFEPILKNLPSKDSLSRAICHEEQVIKCLAKVKLQ